MFTQKKIYNLCSFTLFIAKIFFINKKINIKIKLPFQLTICYYIFLKALLLLKDSLQKINVNKPLLNFLFF